MRVHFGCVSMSLLALLAVLAVLALIGALAG